MLILRIFTKKCIQWNLANVLQDHVLCNMGHAIRGKRIELLVSIQRPVRPIKVIFFDVTINFLPIFRVSIVAEFPHPEWSAVGMT